MRSTICLLCALLAASCGQDEAVFPEPPAGASGKCGAFYPGAEDSDSSEETSTDQESPYGMAEGKIFPCAVWESAQLAGKKTYINVGEEYLAAKHDASDRRSIVILVSAEGCSQCTLLIRYLAEQADDFDAAGAMMIGMARAALGGQGPDFTLEEAVATLAGERWPMDRWYVINDEEYFFDESFESNNPWLAVVSLADMRIVSLGNEDFQASSAGIAELLSLVNSL
ncbi:MAG: hypothetical protein MUC50_04350 [Myxococcota bacterium]|jgi:hypothetical protein|nr:hypothetical protein [Myxococcota bacterium]